MWSQSRDMTAGKWDSGRTAAAPHLLCRLFLEDKEQAGWPLAERAKEIKSFEMSSDNGPFRLLSGVILWLFFYFFARGAEVGDWRQNKGREIWGEFEETSKLRNIADSNWSFQHLRAHLMILEFEFPRRGRIKYSSAFFGLYWGMIQKMDLLYKQIHLLEESWSETRVKPFKMIIDSCVSWNVAHLLVTFLSQTVLWLFIRMLVA